MTEIPEHLLRRSKERRAALGLGGGEGAEAPAAEAPAAEAQAAEAAPAERAATPAPAAPAPAAPPPPPPPPPYVQAALDRPRVPRWALPVLVALPIWGFIYAGTMTEPPAGEDDPLVIGAELYSANCAACHGPSGGGGVGPALTDVTQTFPDPISHVEWVQVGSSGVGIGQPYGSPDRPGGQRIVNGGMPAFAEQLTLEEIVAVVRYEREVLGDAEPWAEFEEFIATGGEGGEGGEAAAGGEGADAGATTGPGAGEADTEGGTGGEAATGGSQTGEAETEGGVVEREQQSDAAGDEESGQQGGSTGDTGASEAGQNPNAGAGS